MAKTWVTGPDVNLTLHSEVDGVVFEELVGVIDTGASVICVDARVVKRLGLFASNRKPVQMADGRQTICSVYSAKMTVDALGFSDFVQVYGVEMDNPSRRVLLGRSFLSNYIVNYDGPCERFEFHETNRGADFYNFDHDE